MKKLIVGLGLTALAVPSVQAGWTGSIEDMRTMQANESRPIVRVKRSYVDTASCGQCHIRYNPAKQHTANPYQRRPPQATGWQRSARVTPHISQRQPLARPVQMYAYYAPQRHSAQQPPRVYRIVGQAQPMCRYIR
ncbi:MAG: hypothetical protein HZT40_01615 [Candidatus Thiothrix singaporensis]|uniref:Uncharacterized protein n=1 Tax=Candidatus Thiothrix singaporensis TaxID=2799669 RepID=A0A7L6AN43_9GAMM|nr:MAG: hypothetical protein HZT40_01615 [Candidatus Thiothrix singaporensis]